MEDFRTSTDCSQVALLKLGESPLSLFDRAPCMPYSYPSAEGLFIPVPNEKEEVSNPTMLPEVELYVSLGDRYSLFGSLRLSHGRLYQIDSNSIFPRKKR